MFSSYRRQPKVSCIRIQLVFALSHLYCEVSLISWYGHFWFPSVAEKRCSIKLSNNSAKSGLNFSTLPQAEKVSRNFSFKSTSYDVNTKSTYQLNVNLCTINTPSLHEPWRYAVGETWSGYTLCSNSHANQIGSTSHQHLVIRTNVNNGTGGETSGRGSRVLLL